MNESMTQRLLRNVVDGETDDELVDDIAGSADAQAEAVELIGVLAQLPGEGARVAESRLDQLLDAVSLVAAGHVITSHVVATAT